MAVITSSIGTTGRTYSTLQLWEDALPASAVTAGNSYVGECYNDSEFTGAGTLLTLAGTTTDSTHTITLKCASGQSFYDNAGKLTNQLKYDATLGVAIRSTSAFQVSTIEVGDQWVTLDGLQVSMGVSGGYSAVNVTAANCTVKNCIGYVSTGNNRAAFSNSASATIVNNLAIQAGTVASNGFDLSGGGTFVACTAVRTTATGGTAFSRNYSTPLIEDCAGFGFSKFGKDTTGSAGSGYNCTDVASGNTPGTNNLFSKTFASQFIDITNTSTMDFRVKAAADLINAGTRDATNTADLDIVKSARSTTTPTIGAWEYAAASGTTVTCTVGDEAEAGPAAAVSLSTVVSTAIYTETEAGPSASVTLSTIVAATVGAEAEAGPAATVSLSTIVAASVGDEQEAGLTATVASATNISLSVANENESGIITAVSVSTQVNCVIGIETEAGLAMTVTSGTTVLCAVGDEQEVGLGATITTGGGLAGATPWYQLALRRGKR